MNIYVFFLRVSGSKSEMAHNWSMGVIMIFFLLLKLQDKGKL